MPIIKSAIKRARQAAKRHERNVATKKNLKAAVKSFLAKPTAESLSKAQSEVDVALKKNLIKKNTASRRKANLAKIAKQSGVKIEAKKAPAKPKTKTVKKAPAKKPSTKKAS